MSDLPDSVRRRTVIVGNTQFRSFNASSDASRQRIDSRSKIRAIHIGRLRHDRNLSPCIRAIGHLRASGFDARLQIVGDGPARHELIQLTYELDLDDCITFFRPNCEDAVVSRLFANANVSVMGAWGGLGVIDALEHGVPVVLWGKESQHPPEAGVVFAHFPDLIDELGTATGIAALLERAVRNASVAARVEAVQKHLETERVAFIERFCSALSAKSKGSSQCKPSSS